VNRGLDFSEPRLYVPDGGKALHPAVNSLQTRVATWDSLILEPAVRLLGLQATITLPDVNLLVFEHNCGSSISILSRRLRHLLPEPRLDAPATRLLGTELCRGHCFLLRDLEACDAPCSNAREHELIRLVQDTKKEARVP
jgi:hypothetical protein